MLLVSRLLIMAQEVFAEHSCNDMPSDFFEGIDPLDKKAITREVVFQEMGDSEVDQFDDEGGDWELADSQWFSYFANKLNTEALK